LSVRKFLCAIAEFVCFFLFFLLILFVIATMKIRKIEPNDNKKLALLIRNVFREFGIDMPGTVYTDPTTDRLFQLFETSGSVYWVVDDDGIIAGGCGIFPTEGLPDGCAELVKFYTSPDYRGKGIGKALLYRCFESAIRMGYSWLYLESFPELAKAVKMYEKAGFVTISHAMGHSGHDACSLWMLKEL
jgi:putative acetyltransferase